MDRLLTIIKPSGHKLAEINFTYENGRSAKASVREFRQLYDDNDPADESKSVYDAGEREYYVDYREYDSIEKIRAADVDFVQKELGRDLKDPIGSYQFIYDDQPVLQRYVIANNRQVIGMVNVRYCFIDNTKEIEFLSAESPKYDTTVSSSSLQTNLSCMVALTKYGETFINPHDIKKLPLW
jgi:hypothetical protein